MPTKVLAFHHVSETPRLDVGPEAECHVTPDRLRAVLEEHAGWRPVDHVTALTGVTTADRRLLVTFDDGYRDTLTDALPVLESLDVPCVIFVVTGVLDGTCRPLENDLGWIASHVPAGSGREGLYHRERTRLWALPPNARVDALAALADRCDASWPPPADDLFLGWDDVVALQQHPLVTIGSHTVTHPRLAWWQWRLAADEAVRSRARLRDVLGVDVECFAYPYGRHGRLLGRGVAAAGYRYAFTTRPHLVESGCDPRAVPRFVGDGPAAARRAA